MVEEPSAWKCAEGTSLPLLGLRLTSQGGAVSLQPERCSKMSVCHLQKTQDIRSRDIRGEVSSVHSEEPDAWVGL